MKVYAYIRVSTNGQDAENQKYAILDYANAEKLGNVEIVEEVVSGTVSWEKRDLAALLSKLQKDDLLVVTELSRLGRSMLEIMEMLSRLTKRGIKVHALKGRYRLDDGIQSKVLAFAFALASEIERDLISQRTKESLARRKEAGQKLGRPKGRLGKSKLDGKEGEIEKLLEHRVAKSAIARLTGISRPALLSFIRTRGLDKGRTKP
jgi:DNA invertase Pin-like site-specific DNA recombinase